MAVLTVGTGGTYSTVAAALAASASATDIIELVSDKSNGKLMVVSKKAYEYAVECRDKYWELRDAE